MVAAGDRGVNGSTVLSGGNLVNNLLLPAQPQIPPHLLDASHQLQPQNQQPILLPLPLHLQQTATTSPMPLQEQLMDINSVGGGNDGSVIKKKKKIVLNLLKNFHHLLIYM